MTPDPRPAPEHWPWPRPCASAAIFRGPTVLLAERAYGPKVGYWSFPGGKVKMGETASQAALREIAEETRLQVNIEGLLDLHDIVQRDEAGRVKGHYSLSVFYGTWVAGEPKAETDISDARFVPLSDVGSYRLTDGAARLIQLAASRLGLA